MYLRIQPDSPGNTSLHHYNNTPTANNVESQEVSLKVISCYCELYNPRQHGQTSGLFPCFKYIPFFFSLWEHHNLVWTDILYSIFFSYMSHT